MAGPLGICAKCGAQAMECRFFGEHLLERRCSKCGNEVRTKPPVLAKKVIYLDQWVISEMANQLDPVLREKKGEKTDPFYAELYADIEGLVKLHVAAFPESPLHYRESLVTPFLDPLRYLYEHLACGTRFDEPLQIYVAQLYDKFLECLVKDAGSEVGQWSSRARVLDGDLNAWSDRIRVSARFPLRGAEVDFERGFRRDSNALLEADAQRWRQSPGRSFDEWYVHHRRDLTDQVLRCFELRIPGIFGMTCDGMVQRLQADGESEQAARDRVIAFLRSDDATRVPYCEISALLFASMSQKVADQGQNKKVGHNDLNDVHAIAAYLPYCDAICVDGYYEELLRKRDVASRMTSHRAQVFSPGKKLEFQAYLRELRGSASAELHDTVLGVYGESWLKPYDTILEYHRSREKKGHSDPRPASDPDSK